MNQMVSTTHMNTGKRYSDQDLAAFRQLILARLEQASTDYEMLRGALAGDGSNGTEDTSPSFRTLEDLSDVHTREEIAQLAYRRQKYITELRNALVRIENRTYGICRATGNLIEKERLMSVPHTTLSIGAKIHSVAA